MFRVANECGVDAVKLQKRSNRTLYTKAMFDSPYDHETSFGATYGQQREWRDPLAFVALAAGVAATIAFPFLMARNRDPLVPLELFRSRNFTVTNISTLVIYGALYVTFYYLALFLQGVLGYSASAAGLAGIPGGLLLVILSTRFGALSARYGPKIFMTVGPALMAIGVLWFARVPATSPAWVFALEITSASVDDLERLSGMAHLNGVPVRLERVPAVAPVPAAAGR